jgi:hypothetical protein
MGLLVVDLVILFLLCMAPYLDDPTTALRKQIVLLLVKMLLHQVQIVLYGVMEM